MSKIFVCIEDFTVCGQTVLDKVTIHQGDMFLLLSIGRDKVRLSPLSDNDNTCQHELIICHEYFHDYFTEEKGV